MSQLVYGSTMHMYHVIYVFHLRSYKVELDWNSWQIYTSTLASDYDALVSDLTFTPGNERICRNIPIINDDLYEDPETFTVSLTTSESFVTIDPTRQTGTAIINDNDGNSPLVAWELRGGWVVL